jgi:hypothetical protein
VAPRATFPENARLLPIFAIQLPAPRDDKKQDYGVVVSASFEAHQGQQGTEANKENQYPKELYHERH